MRALIVGVCLVLLLTACADRPTDADNRHPGSLYGGVSGGMTRP